MSRDRVDTAEPPTPLRVAVVGAGSWGAQHARVFGTRSDVELCGILARRPETARARAAQWHTRAYTDIPAMLQAESPDLVSVCLPNEGHTGPTLQLIRAGVPLLVEKPLAFTVAEADLLVREAGARELFVAVNFNHRYAKAVQLAKRAIDTGRLGELTFATWRFGGEGPAGGPTHANLVETQCHGLDLLEHLCGPIDSVAAQFAGPRRGSVTTLAVALHFASGAVGSLLGSYDSSYAYPDTALVEVNGDRGRVLVEDTVRRMTFSAAGSETREVWEAGYFNDADRAFERTFDRHVDAVVDALRAGNPPPVDITAGARAVHLADAIVRSGETGRRVDTPVVPGVPDGDAAGTPDRGRGLGAP